MRISRPANVASVPWFLDIPCAPSGRNMTIRRTRTIAYSLAGALWAALFAGCGSGETVGPGLGGGAGTLSLARDLQPLLTARCATVGCHVGSSAQAGQDLS